MVLVWFIGSEQTSFPESSNYTYYIKYKLSIKNGFGSAIA